MESAVSCEPVVTIRPPGTEPAGPRLGGELGSLAGRSCPQPSGAAAQASGVVAKCGQKADDALGRRTALTPACLPDGDGNLPRGRGSLSTGTGRTSAQAASFWARDASW